MVFPVHVGEPDPISIGGPYSDIAGCPLFANRKPDSGAACRKVMSLEIAIDGHGWTNGETAAAVELHIAAHSQIR